MALLVGSLLPCTGFAADANSIPGAISQEKDLGNGLSVFAGVRLWANTWDTPLGDTLNVVPAGGPPPVYVKEVGTNRLSSTAISTIPFLGVRVGNWAATVTHQLKTDYHMNDVATGIKRVETDFSLGYAISPYVSISGAYRFGTVDRTLTDSAAVLNNGDPNSAKIRTLLLGVSAAVPISSDWGIYGSVAYGPARTKISSDSGDMHGDYKISEFGFSRRLDLGNASVVKGITFTAGYRTQIITVNDAKFRTYDVSTIPGSAILVSVDTGKQTATTSGLVFGAVGAF